MRILRLVSAGTAMLIIGCTDGPGDPTAPASPLGGNSTEPLAAAASQVQTSGDFDAIVDFSTLTLTPTGQNCRLEVDGRLVFTGTIEGVAIGHTSALVSAPCSDVATTPPGTFKDVFKSEAKFEGTIGGVPASADLLYTGGVEPGGHIDAKLIFSNGVAGVLDADAIVAVGGSYSGSLVVK